MQHLTDDQLALLAVDGLGALPHEAAAPLDTCRVCAQERAVWAELTAALRDPEILEHPSDDVWARIAAELDADAATTAPAPAPPAAPPVPPDTAPTIVSVATPDNVVPLRRPSGRPWIRRIALAAAASFALGAASMGVYQSLTGGPRPEVIQAIGLDPLPGWSEAGTATLESIDGELVLVVELPDTLEDGFREVWLIDRNVERLISLGVMNGDRAEFALPEGVDLDEYVIVDISREDFDGDPSHSGDSIVRGSFA